MLLSTTKYDGTIHYRFMTTPVYEDDDALVVYRGANVTLESYRGAFSSPTHMLNIFYASRYHNTVIMWNEDWTPRMHYVNIATPAMWDRTSVTAVDMDLDVFRRAGEDEVILDDEDEFEHHTRVMGYPDQLVTRCRIEAEEVYRKVAAREGLFSDSIFDWRPERAFSLNCYSPW